MTGVTPRLANGILSSTKKDEKDVVGEGRVVVVGGGGVEVGCRS